MKILVLIPARLESTRLPKKPLININGKTMIETVYNQIKKCKNDLDIMIATDSKEIFAHTTLFNAKTIMTNKNHISGPGLSCVRAFIKHFRDGSAPRCINHSKTVKTSEIGARAPIS